MQQKQNQQKQVPQKQVVQKNAPQKRVQGDTGTSGQKSKTSATQGIGTNKQTAVSSRPEPQKRVPSPVKQTNGVVSVKSATKPQNASHALKQANSTNAVADSTAPAGIDTTMVGRVEIGLPVIGTELMESAARKKTKSKGKKHEKKHAKEHDKKHADAGKHHGKVKKHDKKHGKEPSGGAGKKKSKKSDSPSGKKKKKK